METLTKSQKLAQFFSALGHPRRLKIVNFLANSPKGLTFEAIEAETGIRGASLFHHLRPLRDAGLIDRKNRRALHHLCFGCRSSSAVFGDQWSYGRAPRFQLDAVDSSSFPVFLISERRGLNLQ